MRKFLLGILLLANIILSISSAFTHRDYATARMRNGGGASNFGSDNPARILGGSYTTQLSALPMSGRCSRTPWSADYNAWRYGGISARFGQQDTRWRSYFSSIGAYSQPSDYNSYKDSADFADRVANVYSTAEKYDLLVGDTNFTLTNANKSYGRRVGGSRGDIDSWMGMCDGWSCASWNFPEPLHPVTVTSASGVPVKFWVDDMKNLASLFWRGVKFDNRMVGRRNGPVNAAAFFLIFTNYVGLRGRNINVEPLADNQIWNFPVISYNASTGSGTSRSAARSSGNVVLRQGAANSPAGTASVVYGSMTVTYAKETTASINAKPRKTGSSRFTFMLHLDGSGNIVGGVWTSGRKPSYVWGPASDQNGPLDGAVGSFGGSSGQLQNITSIAQKSSSNMMPLKSIITYLINSSR
jgi:hypothetical protein